MRNGRSSADTPLANHSWDVEGRHWRTLIRIVTFLVVVGVVVGLVVAATTEIGFEEYDDGTELTTQYENIGVVFEPQGSESAGAIVTTCDPSNDDCTAARTGENVIRTPISFEVEHRPLVVRFTEPTRAVALYVREFAWYDGSLTARLIARDSEGEVVARSGIQFDSATGWHRITVSTASLDISQITLTMVDRGQTQEHNYFIVDDLSIRVNEPPTPAFSADPAEPTIGETVKFDASPSTDADGEIAEYRWDFNGDGSIDETTQRSGAATTFDEPGRYSVTLEVEDDDGATDTIVQTLTVSDGPAARCSIPDPEAAPGEQIIIDASDSSADVVRFDIDGDGHFDRTNDDTFRELVRYTETGTVRPEVRAELGGETDTVRCGVITVESTTSGLPWIDVALGSTGGTVGIWFLRRIYCRVKKFFEDKSNNPPIPSITYTPPQPSSIRPVLLDGSTSTDPDPDDRIVTYQWTIEDNELSVPRFVHAFLEGGEYEVELQVTDSRGAIGSVTETITVEDHEGELALSHVHPDAPGNDHENLDQEYIVFENTGTGVLDLGGWTVHDAAEEQDRVSPGGHTFEFPGETIIEPAETVAVHTGSGPATEAQTDTKADHTLFWGSNRAVWNNEADAVVVQDDQDNPVTAVQYGRNEAGGYDIEPLDVETLEDWFPSAAEVRPDAAALTPVSPFDRLREVLSNIKEFGAGCIFLKGPWTFVACWATLTGFLISGSLTWGASTSLGVVTPSFEPIVPLLLVIGAALMLMVGVVWLISTVGVSMVLDHFR